MSTTDASINISAHNSFSSMMDMRSTIPIYFIDRQKSQNRYNRSDIILTSGNNV